MDKRIIVLIIVLIILIAGVLFVVNSTNVRTNNNITNNTTNNTTTKELNITNWTLSNDSKESSNTGQSAQSSKQSSSEPDYNSDEYVKKWDQSQQGGGSWAYTHSQPTKTGEDGHQYKRMYNPDTGESYWGYMY